MTAKAPSGVKHAPCLEHVAHPAGPKGWLCITTSTEDRAWPRVERYRPPLTHEGPFLPKPAPDVVAVDRRADMIAFAGHIAAARGVHHAAELARRTIPALTAADYAMVAAAPGNPGATVRVHPLPTDAAPSGLRHLPFDRAEDRAARVRMAAELDERKGRSSGAAVMVAPAVKAPRRKAAPVVHVEPLITVTAEPEPVPVPVEPSEPVSIVPRPVLAILAAERPTCARCGQVFRMHGTGAEWHRLNRPDCAAGRSPVSIAS